MPTYHRRFKCRDCHKEVKLPLDMNRLPPTESQIHIRARNALMFLYSCVSGGRAHGSLIELHDRRTPLVRLTPPTPEAPKIMKHQHGEGTKVNEGSARLELTREHASENYQRFVAKLSDGTTLKVWIPRLDFRDLTNETRDIVVYQNRENKRPNPINLDDSELVTVKRRTTRTKRTK